jgi:hypothetical protein
MKLQLDTKEKTIKVEDDVKLADLLEVFEEGGSFLINCS